ncbi:hypothetical protein VMCG_03154 [Cytospora schulzeri]|uniref:PAS domain-containing protein n=1 Tax=Cytospora schulzeri TaxID=448051 RepID=A0A423WXM3_9PEZI|nr:hypothetical protein VMCG_03154 [Valsa malicola]
MAKTKSKKQNNRADPISKKVKEAKESKEAKDQPKRSHLYTDETPETAIQGAGFKDAETAKKTISLVSKRSLTYQWQTINTMYNRAKHHPKKTKDIEAAQAVFQTWLKETYPKEKREQRSFKPLSKKTVEAFLPLLEQTEGIDTTFADMYVNLEARKRLANTLVDEKEPGEPDWDRTRTDALAKLYRFTEQDKKKRAPQDTQPIETPGTNDHLFYPGLYCPSGLDVMSVLLRIFARPNPEIDLGPIDGSVALVVCDLALQDVPIVYASDAFLALTGYQMDEIRGRNCRFLQAPGGRVPPRSAREHVGPEDIRGMREAIGSNKEHQTEITNFKKGGEPFVNILTIIPITWDSEDYRYSVGFQCQKE